jgi:enoyl-CoA hydratase/carnithine racemase
MAFVETKRENGIMVIRLNRPERLNALGSELRTELERAWEEFRETEDQHVAILTGTGRAFCAGGDLKEMVEQGSGEAAPPEPHLNDPYEQGRITKPVIAAINGFAFGGGFGLAELADLRIASKSATFEMSGAKRWLLGSYQHGFINGLPHAIGTELAFSFRFTAERMYELGFLNRVTEPDDLMPTALEMAKHLLTLAPATRVNTVVMMREMRPRVPVELEELAARLHTHGSHEDFLESRRAFVEKRAPSFKGWDNPEDRFHTPTLESMRQERNGG